MVRLSLLFEAALRGLRVRIDEERLVVRGPRREERLALEILGQKGEVMTLLRARPELANLDAFTADVALAFGGEVVSESDGPAWDESVPLDSAFLNHLPNSPWQKSLLRLRGHSRCGVELVGPCSAARKAASAVPPSLFLQHKRPLCLATRLSPRAAKGDGRAHR